MKQFYIFLIGFTLVNTLNAQTIVSTNPQNKKVILEEFTGTGCPNCPGGHTTAANLLIANPGDLFVVAYHPSNSSYTSGDPMVRTYPAAFYTIPFISPSNRYMPSAIIGRRVWGGVERIQGTGSWASDVNTIKGESSPLNVGVSSSYNTSNNTLTVNIEVYFTNDVTNPLTLYAMITEDGIIANQSGGSSTYVHNHVFREALPKPTPAQWGETIAAPTTQGTVKTYTYTFDNTTTNYVMSSCEVIVFVRDASTEETVSGNGAPVGSSSPTGISNISLVSDNFSVFPNPLSDNSQLYISLLEIKSINYQIYDILGNLIVSKDLGMLAKGKHQFEINTVSLEKGIYFIKINNGLENSSIKVIK